ncbi:MAG: CoA-binding protein, partial [Lacipirellulaceae bacterium]
GYDVYPVNPKGGEIEGLTAYASIGEVPVEHLDRISLYVPPTVGEKLLPAIAEKGCDELWLNPGSESEALVEAARQAGLEPIVACSIVDLGESPGQYGE